jgi:hypothetical protein
VCAPVIARSAARMSAAVANRSSGFFASAFMITTSSDSGMFGFCDRGDGGGLVRWASTTSPQPSLTNGGAPHNIS